MSFLNDYKIYQKNSNKWSDNPAASEGSWMIAQEHIHIQILNFLDCNSANREGETEKGTTQTTDFDNVGKPTQSDKLKKNKNK